MYLLDVNVLIALAWDDHVHHDRAHAWFRRLANESFATCNVTQSGFVRVSLNPDAVHCQIGITDVFEMLESFTKHPNQTDIHPFIISADVICVANFSFVINYINGICMIFHKKPIPDIFAFSINRNGLIILYIVD